MNSRFLKNLGISLVLALGLVAVSYGIGELLVRPSPPVAAKAPAPEQAAPAAAPAAVAEIPAEAPAEAPATAAADPLAGLLSAADPARGDKIARKCKSCHTFDKGGKNRVGPNLWDVVGRPRGKAEGFAYSDAFALLEGRWSFAALNAFLANPRTNVKGTKMSIGGFKDPAERADLIVFLRSLSDQPQPLP